MMLRLCPGHGGMVWARWWASACRPGGLLPWLVVSENRIQMGASWGPEQVV